MKNKKSQFTEWGFTLIELLVVIAIIGILAALALVSFTSAQKQARDVQRASDLKQYQTALESYASNNNGLYPEWDGVVYLKDDVCPKLSVGSCPEDPKYTGTGSLHNQYKYISTQTVAGSNGNPLSSGYVVWAQRENDTKYVIYCSTGKNGSVVTEPSAGSRDCPL